MSLESIVNTTILAGARGVAQQGFGIPLVVGKHSAWADRYRVYELASALETLVSEGIVAGSPIYKAVQSVASNTPKPKYVAVGRLVSAFTQSCSLTIKTAIEGDVFSFVLQAPNGGAATTISYTVQNGDTTTDVATAIAALINAVDDITASGAAAVITAAADNTDEMWRFEGYDVNQIDFTDDTADSSLATEVGEIKTLYNGWYGLILADPNSKARVTALAAYIETTEKIFGVTSYDTDNLDPTSEDSVMFTLKASTYYRTYCLFSGDQKKHAAATWIGNRFPAAPGSSTWEYKPLSGIIVDDLTANQYGSIVASNGNFYTEVAGLSVTQNSKTAGGEWIDVIRFRDWIVARIRETVFGLLANAEKIPFTNKGVSVITNGIRSVIRAGINAGGIDPEADIIVTAPDVADVSDANKIGRILPDVYFECTLAGAIHATVIKGYLKV